MKKHTMTDRTPYTYVVKNKVTGKRYYGCRYAKNCHPSDLWRTYFTSSKNIKSLLKSGDINDWEFEVRKVFDNIFECKFWEAVVLRRLKVPKNKHWYNQSRGDGKFILQGAALDLQKKNLSARMTVLLSDPVYVDKMNQIRKERWSTPESRILHSEKIKACWKDEEWAETIKKQRKEYNTDPAVRERKREAMIEVWQRPEYIQKHKESMKKVHEDAEWRENNRQKQMAAWKDPVKRENMMSSRKPQTEETRAQRSSATAANNKASWADPVVRQRRIDGLKAAKAKNKAAKEAALHQSTVSIIETS